MALRFWLMVFNAAYARWHGHRAANSTGTDWNHSSLHTHRNDLMEIMDDRRNTHQISK